MLSYFRKRAFRSHVQNTIIYLLGFDQTVIEPVLKAYPGIRNAIDGNFFEGKSATNSAVGILTAVFTNEIERGIPESDRTSVEEYIRGSTEETKYMTARGIKSLLSQANIQKDLGAVDEFHYQYMLSEIVGALRGLPANERMANRVVAPLRSGIGIAGT